MGHVAIPSYRSGFYSPKRGGIPKYPQLWRGCVGAWCPSLGPTGLRLMDQSLHGNHGTLTNMDAASDWVVSGGRGALDFDGSNDYVLLPEGVRSASVFPRAAGCVSIWFTATFGRTNGLFGNLDLGDRYALWIDSSNSVYFDTLTSNPGVDRLVVSGLSWTNGQLYNLVFTSGNGTGMRIYRDGLLVGSQSTNPVISNPVSSVWIGAVRATSFQLQGTILSCTLWNIAMSDRNCRLLGAIGPTGMFQLDRQRNRYAAPATGTAVPVFMHHYLQQGVA